jgi:hypothetical protein
LSTWSARDVTGTFTSLNFPLGFHRDLQPRISYTRVEPGDVVAVVSWQLAKLLHDSGRLDQNTGASAFQDDLAGLTQGSRARQFHGAICRIANVQQRMASNSGDTEDIGRLMGSRYHAVGTYSGEIGVEIGGRTPNRFDTLGSGLSIDGAIVQPRHVQQGAGKSSVHANTVESGQSPETSTERRSTRPASPRRRSVQQQWISTPAESHRDTLRQERKGHNVELFAGLLLSLSAAVVGVWQVTKRDRPIHGPRDDGTLGLPHLQRWSDSYQAPRFERVRRVSPRMQIHGVLIVVVVALAAVAAVVFAAGQFWGRDSTDLAGFDARLQEIATVRSQTDVGVATEMNFTELSNASVALDDLEASTTSDDLLERIGEERQAIESAMAQLTSSEYLGNIQVLGSLPAHTDDVTARLFSGGGRVYVFNGTLFELDQVSNTLVQLLAPGDLVGGDAVGKLLAATWNEDRPMVVDSNFAYMREPSDARWHRVPLGVFSAEGHSNITAIDAFNRNLYYLTADSGQILRFDALDYSMEPDDWASGASRDLLERGVDLYIDGSIHVVLDNGTILTFFRSALERTLQPTVIPELERISAITSIYEGAYYFMADSASGRIVGVSNEGELYRQFVPRDDIPVLYGATDLVINEGNGITYVIANDTLYAVRISLPERPAQE